MMQKNEGDGESMCHEFEEDWKREWGVSLCYQCTELYQPK
jgi:hypothetical protein